MFTIARGYRCDFKKFKNVFLLPHGFFHTRRKNEMGEKVIVNIKT